MGYNFQISHADIKYEAAFVPPIIELISPEKQIIFVKGLSEKFGLHYGDLIVNPQNLSRSFIFFRKYSPGGGFFDINMGVDYLLSYYVNPASPSIAWEPSLKLLEIINSLVETLPINEQTLTFNLQCIPKEGSADEVINRYNTFPEHEKLKSKALSFTFEGPVKDSRLLLILDKSIINPNGLYIMAQFSSGRLDENKELFNSSLDFLLKVIQPAFDLNISFKN
jgi:hypothetical protein